MKKYILPAVVLSAVIITILLTRRSAGPVEPGSGLPSGADPANTTYLIDGEPVTFTKAVSEIPAAPGSSSTIRTIIFSQPVVGDLNADGRLDMALLFQRTTPGSGTFYYFAVALQNADKTVQGTNAILVGDRIAPQTMEIKDGVAILNYADRKPGEPMTTKPSLGVSLRAVVRNGELVRQESTQ